MTRLRLWAVVLLLALGGSAKAQSLQPLAKAIEKVLDAYCIQYYDTDFPQRSYIENTISVSVPETLADAKDSSDGSYELTGTHSYRGQFRSIHSNVRFRVSIKPIGINRYRIKFDKWFEADLLHSAHWENGPTREFVYRR